MKKIPTEQYWSGYHNDIDARYAYKIFFGKSNEDMQPAFKRNVIERTDELRFMPIRAYQYYIFGLRDYVRNRDFDVLESSDAASCFIKLALEKLKDAPNSILPILDELLPDLEYVANNQDLYEAEVDIYGDFKNIYKEILIVAGKNA